MTPTALPCGCTVHTRCPQALVLWTKVRKLWPKYHASAKEWHDVYFAATGAYLAHRDGVQLIAIQEDKDD